MTATVVLVHGAWSGAWIWKAVGERLDERQVPYRTVDLPTCSATAPNLDFRDDAKHVREAIDAAGGPVVLAGNSYGGVVITEAAAGIPAVKRLVYLAAFMPDAGEVLFEMMTNHSDPIFGTGIRVGENGLVVLDGEMEMARAFQLAPPDQRELVAAHLEVPMSVGTDPSAAVTEAAWRSIPSTYAVCTEDLSIKPASQRQWAEERATDYVEWPSDHCPQNSRPADVADLLAKLARDIP